LIQILYDVVDMLNTDAQPDHLRHDSRDALFFGRHLPVVVEGDGMRVILHRPDLPAG